MKILFKIFIVLTGLLWNHVVYSQTEASVSLDTNSILIGDQVNLELSFVCPADYEVVWPFLTDTVTSQIEILRHTELSSTLSNNQYDQIYQQSFTITCFDSGYFAIPPLRINYRKPGDSILHFSESEALILQVNTVPVNMEEEIKDIKDPWRAPFTFKEALPFILIFLAAVIIGLGVYYYIRKRKKAEPVFKPSLAKKIPPHQAAIDSLEALRYKKLWQNGHLKEYHTELTDIIREYIWANFNIHALEFTTDEIMESINGTGTNYQAKEKLHQTLVLADMVKFAKMEPLPLEHDACLNNAIDFVRETKHLTHTKEFSQEQDPGPDQETVELLKEENLLQEEEKEVKHDE